MLTIKVSTKALEIAKQKLVADANRRYRRIVYDAFEAMLEVSPQYSGDYTSNWHIVTEHDSLPSYKEWPLKHDLDIKQQPRRAGDPLAVGYARSQMVRKPFNYKDKVYFFNPTPLEFTTTTVTGAGGTMKLRPENIIGSGILITSFVRAYLKGKT